MSEDPVLEALLKEAAGNDAPDVRLRVLQTASEQGLLEGRVPAGGTPASKASLPPERRRGTLVALVGWAAAACAIFALGWLLIHGTGPKPAPTPTLPPTVAVADGGSYELREGSVYLSEGVALVREGAPTVYVGESTVKGVKGMALVSPGGIPGDREINELETQLRRGGQLKPEEIEMLKNRKRWIISGGVALCVLAGSVALNGDVVDAQMRVKRESKKTEGEAESEKKKESEGNATGSDAKVEAKKVRVYKEDPRQAKSDEDKAADLKTRTDKKVDDFFGKVDKDKDGTVSKEEIEDALGAEAGTTLKKMDGDGDGKISREEAEKQLGDETKKEEEEANTSTSGGGIAIGGGAVRKPSKSASGEGSSTATGEKKQEGESNNKKKEDKKD